MESTSKKDLMNLVEKAPKCQGYSGQCIHDKFTGFDYEYGSYGPKDYGYCEITIGADGEIYYEPVCRMCYAHRNAFRGAAIMAKDGRYIYHGKEFRACTKFSTNPEWKLGVPDKVFTRDPIASAYKYQKASSQAEKFLGSISADHARKSVANLANTTSERLAEIVNRYVNARKTYDQTYNVDIDLVMEIQKVVSDLRITSFINGTGK